MAGKLRRAHGRRVSTVRDFDQSVAADGADTCPNLQLLAQPQDRPAALRQNVECLAGETSLGRLCCSMYCDDRMIVNGLIALGSFKLMASRASAVLFVPNADAFRWLKGLDVIDAAEPLRSAMIHPDPWSALHPGITGHYYRKVAMWLYLLQNRTAPASEWHLFIDADVLFVRPLTVLMRYVGPHRFAAMIEHWHPSLWSVFRGETPQSRQQAALLFHHRAAASRMKRTRYFNSGVMLARPDDDVQSAVKDVLLASMLYPELSRDIRLPEQTLLNVATMVRQIPCCDLFGLCVPSYHDQERGWPAPVVRHYLGDPLHRQPALLHARYLELVDKSLEAVGTSVDDLKDRGLWPNTVNAASIAISGEQNLGGQSQFSAEQNLSAESEVTLAASRRLRVNRPSAFGAVQRSAPRNDHVSDGVGLGEII